MKAIVLAGGTGTRLWPFSREDYPKQLLALGDKYSYLQRTFLRLTHSISYSDLYVVTSYSNYWDVCHQLKQLDQRYCNQILIEPAARDTAPAIALAYLQMVEDHSITDDQVIFITPSDHHIADQQTFEDTLKKAEKLAQEGWITLLGITPSSPETGYGYLKKGKMLGDNAYQVERFVEKPHQEKAQNYFTSGAYLWNAGMLCLTAGVLRSALKHHLPELAELIALPLYKAMHRFRTLQPISFDYRVLEHSNNVAAVPAQMGWSDIGSWDSVGELLPCDANGNMVNAKLTQVDSHHCIIIGKERPIATIDLENILIIDAEDSLLVAKKGSSEKVKEVVKILKDKCAPELYASNIRHYSWGNRKIIAREDTFEIQKITLLPGAKSSSKPDSKYIKNWMVVEGSGTLSDGEMEWDLVRSTTHTVATKKRYTLHNDAKAPLVIIETRTPVIVPNTGSPIPKKQHH